MYLLTYSKCMCMWGKQKAANAMSSIARAIAVEANGSQMMQRENICDCKAIW